VCNSGVVNEIMIMMWGVLEKAGNSVQPLRVKVCCWAVLILKEEVVECKEERFVVKPF
jgi:hypothetical protein